MNSNVNTNVNFETETSTTTTTSTINSGNNSNDSINQPNTYSSRPTTATETMDLTFATNLMEQIDYLETNMTGQTDSDKEILVEEDKSFWDSVGDFFYDVGDFFSNLDESIENTGAQISRVAKALVTWDIDELKEIGSEMKQACANLASNVSTIAGSFLGWAKDTATSVASTAAVIGTTVVSGVLDIGEGIVDGLAWCGGKLVEGGSWLVGKVAGCFSDDAEESVMEWRSEASKDIKEFIATDWIGKANDWFYQDTEIGRTINEKSYIKYDSEAMKKVRGITEKVGTLVLATAATIVTGGAAAPFVLGFLYGTGTQAEKTYQEYGTDTTFMQELGIGGSGLLTGLSWIANGKLGAGAFNIAKDCAALGAKNVLPGLLKSVLSKDFWLNAAKEGLSLKNAKGKININAIMNYVTSAFGTAGTLTPYITGEEEFTATSALKVAGTYLGYLGLNILEDGLRDTVSGYKAMDAIVNTLGEDASIYTRGLDLNATAQLIPIPYLISIIKDPKLASEILSGDITDKMNGFTKFELGNALLDFQTTMSKNGYDFGFDETELSRMQTIIDTVSGDPIEINLRLFNESFWKCRTESGMLNDTLEFFDSPDGIKAVEYARNIGQGNFYRLNTNGPGICLSSFREALETAPQSGYTIQNPKTFELFVEMLAGKENITDADASYLKKVLEAGQFTVNPRNQDVLAQLLKRAEFVGYEEEVARRLGEFAGAYVSQGKVQSIIGSCEYQTTGVFKRNYSSDTAMAYNNGRRSVMDLQYSSAIIKDNVNHESLHQLSADTETRYDPQTGARISISGVRTSIWNGETGEWERFREGLNESITEYFNKLTMGGEYANYSGYSRGVTMLESFVDAGFVTIQDLKNFYFTHDGEGLTRYIARNINIGNLSFSAIDFITAFDQIISRKSDEITEGTKSLNKMLKEFIQRGIPNAEWEFAD